MWADFDYRNTINTSWIYYQGYQSGDRPSLGRAIGNIFNQLLAAEDFKAEWVAVITWNDALPYPYWWWQYYYFYYFYSQVCMSSYFSLLASTTQK